MTMQLKSNNSVMNSSNSFKHRYSFSLCSNGFSFFLFFQYENLVFKFCSGLTGRATEAHISGEEAEALPCSAGGSRRVGSSQIAGERGGSGEGHAQERGAGGTRSAT